MSNPIKVALEAGVLAYASLPVEENPRRCARVIAAFLRALPPAETTMDHPSRGVHSLWTLAAAVEAAARADG